MVNINDRLNKINELGRGELLELDKDLREIKKTEMKGWNEMINNRRIDCWLNEIDKRFLDFIRQGGSQKTNEELIFAQGQEEVDETGKYNFKHDREQAEKDKDFFASDDWESGNSKTIYQKTTYTTDDIIREHNQLRNQVKKLERENRELKAENQRLKVEQTAQIQQLNK